MLIEENYFNESLYKELKKLSTEVPFYYSNIQNPHQMGSWVQFGLQLHVGKNPELTIEENKSKQKRIETLLDWHFEQFTRHNPEEYDVLGTYSILVTNSDRDYYALKAFFFNEPVRQTRQVSEADDLSLPSPDDIV